MGRMKIVNARGPSLTVHRFETLPGQAWCLIGTNRSGIRPLFDLVCGSLETVTADGLELPERLGRVSFKQQQQIYEQELKKDDTDYLDRPDPGTLAREFLHHTDRHTDLIRAFGLTRCLDKGYRQLSTGQARKLMILSQITRQESSEDCRAFSLAIQAPFEGLDPDGVEEADQALNRLHQAGVSLFLFVHNLSDIPSWVTHLALVADGGLVLQGPRETVFDRVRRDMQAAVPDFRAGASTPEPEPAGTAGAGPRELVRLKNGCAGYGGKTVFSRVDLTIVPGGHTLVTGPNGSGKSTLVHMVTGDHPSCYTNDLNVFGIRRGTGESIWQIKEKMGIVSPELHRNYHIPGPVLHCILSGLFDSIGLYRPYSPEQEKAALAWLDRLGMRDQARSSFRDLTYADQRLVLLARALIKEPALLILDEPTQGLDQANREAVLDFLEEMARLKRTTILYVSHRSDEYRPFFVNRLAMPLPRP